MFHLTREVRFAINIRDDHQLGGQPTNSFGGFPSLTGLGHYFALRVTVSGQLAPDTQYLCNIKQIDQAVRTAAIPVVQQSIRQGRFGGGALLVIQLLDVLREVLPSVREITLSLTPTLLLTVNIAEESMVKLSQRFEFSASHRLHNPSLSEEENRRTFGKCNNANGHGHNYELQVTLAGKPDADGVIIEIPRFERIVSQAVIDKFDHRNLNIEIPEFKELIPTVENIAKVIFTTLKPKFDGAARLASVTVWETPKTWCEYSE